MTSGVVRAVEVVEEVVVFSPLLGDHNPPSQEAEAHGVEGEGNGETTEGADHAQVVVATLRDTRHKDHRVVGGKDYA